MDCILELFAALFLTSLLILDAAHSLLPVPSCQLPICPSPDLQSTLS